MLSLKALHFWSKIIVLQTVFPEIFTVASRAGFKVYFCSKVTFGFGSTCETRWKFLSIVRVRAQQQGLPGRASLSTWFENDQAQRRQISLSLTFFPFKSRIEWPPVLTATTSFPSMQFQLLLYSRLTGLQFCSSAFTVSFHSTKSDAQLKFDSGMIFLVIIQQIVTLSKYGHNALDICHL